MEDLLERRFTLSGVTSILLALVFIFLPYVPAQYSLLRYLVALILFVDGFFKITEHEKRSFFTIVYSLAMALALATFFQIFGQPFSYIAAGLFVIDAILKYLPGSQSLLCCTEEQFRHMFSGVVTVLIGLGILFGVSTTIPFFSVIAGLFIIADGLVKLEYAYIL